MAAVGAAAPGALLWRPGGAEVLVWTNLGPHLWAAVWPCHGGGWTAWVCFPGPPHRHIEDHETQDEAKQWCEAIMQGEAKRWE